VAAVVAHSAMPPFRATVVRAVLAPIRQREQQDRAVVVAVPAKE